MNFLIIILTLISFIAFKFYQARRVSVPEGLKNVPTLSFLRLLISILLRESPDKRWQDTREIFEKEGIGKLWFGGEWTVFVTDLDLVREVITKSDLYPKTNQEFNKNLFHKHYGTNIVFSNGEVWKRYRRIANPAFRNIPLPIFSESAVELLEVMEKIDNKPVELNDLMHGLTLDALGKISFGFNFNSLKDPNNIYVTTYTETMKELGNLYYYLLPFLNYLPRTKAYKRMASLNSLYDKIIENKRKSMETGELDKRINNNSADLLDYMVKASCDTDPESPTMSSDELRYNVAIFMLAGHDTTAHSLSTVLYLLSAHKDVQQKVREEILRVLGDDLTPSMEQQKELKYMSMVLHENLRLYPPVAQLQGRRASREVKFRNYVIPANTNIMLYVYGIHYSTKNWENPEKFIPERFENEKHYQGFLTFGGGDRLCLGNNFSLIEQRVVLCALLRKYEVSLPADSIHKDKLITGGTNNGTVGPYPNLFLKFKRRTE